MTEVERTKLIAAINELRRELEQIQGEVARKNAALMKAADTFRDFQSAMTLLGHNLSAKAAAIAEEATRKAISPDYP